MRFNTINFEASAENKEAQETPEVETPKVEEKPKVETEVKETSKEETQEKKVSVVEKPKETAKKEPEKIEDEKPQQVVTVEQENLILKQSISTGFDAEILTALIAQDVVNGSNPFGNLQETVEKYVEKYPQMLKKTAKPTPGIAPTESSGPNKMEQQRERYFGTSKTDFWQGSGVRGN